MTRHAIHRPAVSPHSEGIDLAGALPERAAGRWITTIADADAVMLQAEATRSVKLNSPSGRRSML
jgi:hypothetical protein